MIRSDRQSAWRTMDRGSWHCQGDSDQYHPKKEKGKMLVWGSLTNHWEKKRFLRQGEKKRYNHLNAGFQRRAKKDKRAFLSDQCKDIEENNRMEKTRDLLKKIKGTKGKIHAKMDTIKDRNGMDVTEAEDIKKRWEEYTEPWWCDHSPRARHPGVQS